MPSRRIEDLHPAFQPLARELLARCQAAGHNVVITCGLRTIAEQDALYAQGRTRPGKKVTNAPGGASWHNYGLAVDVAFVSRDGRVGYTGPWEAAGRIGEALGLTWGGRFKRLVDRPHFEWHPGVTLAQAREFVRRGCRPTAIPILGIPRTG